MFNSKRPSILAFAFFASAAVAASAGIGNKLLDRHDPICDEAFAAGTAAAVVLYVDRKYGKGADKTPAAPKPA